MFLGVALACAATLVLPAGEIDRVFAFLVGGAFAASERTGAIEADIEALLVAHAIGLGPA